MQKDLLVSVFRLVPHAEEQQLLVTCWEIDEEFESTVSLRFTAYAGFGKTQAKRETEDRLDNHSTKARFQRKFHQGSHSPPN